MHNGRRILASHTFDTKADANAWLDDQSSEIRKGAWIDPKAGQLGFRKYAERWLDSRNLAERTRDLYDYNLEHYIYPTFENLTLSQIGPVDVRTWFAPLSQRIPTTAAKCYRLLSTILKTAVEDELILRNPCRVKGASSEPESERPVLSRAELDSLVAAAPRRVRLLFLLAAYCQLRRGELLGLRRRDINLLHGTLTVHLTRGRSAGREVVKAPKSAAGRRTIAIPSVISDQVADHLQSFTASSPDALLFMGKYGKPLHIQTLSEQFSRARHSIGRDDLHLHDLRHTGLTWFAIAGATTKELMARGGHASPNAALRYQHATQDRDKALAEMMMPREDRATPIKRVKKKP